jgi:hypothetical protein
VIDPLGLEPGDYYDGSGYGKYGEEDTGQGYQSGGYADSPGFGEGLQSGWQCCLNPSLAEKNPSGMVAALPVAGDHEGKTPQQIAWEKLTPEEQRGVRALRDAERAAARRAAEGAGHPSGTGEPPAPAEAPEPPKPDPLSKPVIEKNKSILGKIGDWLRNADLFIGVEVDLAGGPIGVDLSAGIVVDFENPMESGLYGGIGPAAGANAGIAGTIGLADEIEGRGYTADANIPGLSVSPNVMADDQGFNGVAIGVWPGVGVSVSATETGTYSIADFVEDVKS